MGQKTLSGGSMRHISGKMKVLNAAAP